MTALEQRIVAALNGTLEKPPWEALIHIFERDREAFYLLACSQEYGALMESLRELADRAAFVRRAIRESYRVESPDHDASIVTATGERETIPSELTREVVAFLRRVDGKETRITQGKDYEGETASEAEVHFKLGDASSRERDTEALRKRQESSPFVLKIPPDEIELLASQPAYVIHELRHCARATILAPTSIFRGLKRGGGGRAVVDNGWAFCGRPRLAYDNHGVAFTAPTGMVHVVYASEQGDIFDWDWVNEDPSEAGYPLDWQMRFDRPVDSERDFVLDLPEDLGDSTYNATVACYSSRGDCIFCYMSDAVSFAKRINPDLTVFHELTREVVTGFKLKNVRRILEKDRDIVIKDAPDITVSVQSVLLATLKLHPEASVSIYDVLITALRKSPAGSPTVRVPREAAFAGAN